MATILPAKRSVMIWRPILQGLNFEGNSCRSLHTIYSLPKQKIPFPENLPESFLSQIPAYFRKQKVTSIQVPPRPSCPSDNCKNPIQKVTETQLATLDPAGEREALFNRKNREGIKPGDILRVTFKTGEPFAGVCLNVRSRGIDTGFLLRNKLTKLSVEMWIKGYSPNVQSVEIVQRREKRARRARLTYMRHPKHDVGSVDGIVRQYLREKALLASDSQKSSKQQRKSKR